MTLVFSGLAVLFPLGNYLSDNSASSIERRYRRENAEVIAAQPAAYTSNRYEIGPFCDEEDADDVRYTLPGTRRILQTSPDSGPVILIIAD